MGGATVAAEADEAMRRADLDPGPALPVAARAAERAHREGELAAAAVAERAWGHCLLHCGQIDDAIRHLRIAIRCSRRAGSAELEAEARTKLAYGLMQNGRAQAALFEMAAALPVLTGAAGVRARSMHATILNLAGRPEEALTEFAVVLPILRRTGDLLGLQKALINRAYVQTARHAFNAAESDLIEAEELARQLGRQLTIAIIAENLGWLEILRGDVPAALGHLERAERIGSAHGAGSVVGQVFQDRAELLLGVGVLDEAREAAEQAVVAYTRDDRRLNAAQSQLLLAQAAFLGRDWITAQTRAQQAMRNFGGQHRPAWTALAQLTVLRAQLAAGTSPRLPTERVDHMIDVLRRAGWPAATLEAQLVAARIARHRGLDDSAHLTAAARPATRRAPAALRARAWYAQALHRLQDGDRRAAATAVRAGLRVLDEHRAGLISTDLRAHAAVHRGELAELGLRMALDDGRPARVFEWAERIRAGRLWPRPVRPPADPELAELLTQLRATAGEVDERQAADAEAKVEVRAQRGSGALVARQVDLERRIRDRSRQQRGAADVRLLAPVDPTELASALDDWARVEFVALDDVLHAVTVVDGRIRLHHLAPVPAVAALLERLPFALRHLARAAAGREARVLELLRTTAAQLDAVLLRPLRELDGRPLVVVPTGPLHAMAWSLLPSCRGRPLTTVPSATVWHSAAIRPVSTGKVVVAAGPLLRGARAEAAAVAEVYGAAALLDGAATVEAVLTALPSARLAHLAAHGRLSPDNPLFSDLLLADGPLVVHDLDRLAGAPHTVVLAACDSGRSVVHTGDALLGLSAAFLTRGTAQLVAPVVPVPDAETTPLMVALHHRLAAGRPAAVALAEAQEETSGAGPATIAAGAGFVCIGHGRAPLPPA